MYWACLLCKFWSRRERAPYNIGLCALRVLAPAGACITIIGLVCTTRFDERPDGQAAFPYARRPKVARLEPGSHVCLGQQVALLERIPKYP